MARKEKDEKRKIELEENLKKQKLSIQKTYESFERLIKKISRTLSSWLDLVLFNQRFAKIIALCLAIIIYLVVNGSSGSSSLFASNVQSVVTLEEVSVTTNISDSVYEISGLPETVSVDVKGSSSDVQLASQNSDSYYVLADLEVFGEGTHEITLEAMNFSDSVEVTVSPSTAVVTIKKKISRTYTIGYDFVNTSSMSKIYTLGEPTFSQSEVIVRASEDTISEISYVKALIDVSGVKADFTQEAVLVAYNASGEKMDVDILPETVSVEVSVTSPSKEVAVEIVPSGTLADGLAIESYTLDYETITIYGAQSVLDAIDAIQISVPVNKITADTTITMPITLPTGVNTSSVSRIQISLKISEATSKTLKVPITYIGLDENLEVTSSSFENITVTITGAESVIDAITSDDITVSVDVSGYLSGTYSQLVLTVEGENALATYTIDTDTIDVTLSELLEDE